MQIQWRRGPNGTIETFFQGRWQPTDQAWLDARAASGHTLVEDAPATAPSPGQAAQRERQVTGFSPGQFQRAFAPDAARLSPQGAVLSRPATQVQGGVNPAVFSPDGARLSPEGAILSLPGQPPAPQPLGGGAAVPAIPNEATRGNNPGATWNPTTQTWNVDPAGGWNQGAPMSLPSAPVAKPQRPGEDYSGLDPTTGRPPPSPYTMDGLTTFFNDRLGEYARGGMVRTYAEGGQVDEPPRTITLPGQEPNAIVGEGMEADNPEFDKPQRLEIVLVPTGKASTFTGYWSEGPVMTQLEPGTLITPVPNHLESTYREQLLPITAMPAPKAPSMEGEIGGAERMSLPGAEMGPPPEYAAGGMVPYGAPTTLEQQPRTGLFRRDLGLWNDPWEGLTNTGFGSVRDYARASEGARERRNQLLILGGRLGGAEDELGFFQRHAPGALSTPVYG